MFPSVSCASPQASVLSSAASAAPLSPRRATCCGTSSSTRGRNHSSVTCAATPAAGGMPSAATCAPTRVSIKLVIDTKISILPILDFYALKVDSQIKKKKKILLILQSFEVMYKVKRNKVENHETIEILLKWYVWELLFFCLVKCVTHKNSGQKLVQGKKMCQKTVAIEVVKWINMVMN